jgi:hypothetical protein
VLIHAVLAGQEEAIQRQQQEEHGPTTRKRTRQ